MGWRALAIGAGSYLLLSSVFGRLASATSILSSFPNLLILGFWMLLYRTGSPAEGRRGLLALGLLPLLPLTTLVTGGFLGYGFHWVLGTLAFYYVEGAPPPVDFILPRRCSCSSGFRFS